MPGAPARLRAFALTCLAKNPSGRPTDATEALVMLDHPLSLRVRGRLFRVLAGRVLGRKTALAAAAAALLAAAGLLGLWLLVPVGVRHEGKQVYWETRGGWESRARSSSSPWPRSGSPKPGWDCSRRRSSDCGDRRSTTDHGVRILPSRG